MSSEPSRPPAAATAGAIVTGAREAQSTLVTASAEAAGQVKSLAADVQRSLSMAGTATAESITSGAREAQGVLVSASADAATQVKSLAADMQRSLSMAGCTPPREIRSLPPARARPSRNIAWRQRASLGRRRTTSSRWRSISNAR